MVFMRIVIAFCLLTVPAFAGQLRVLPPVVRVEDSPIKKVVGLYLRHRLSECAGVEVIEGQRAERISQWLASGAFVLNARQRWDRIRSFVDVDAILQVQVTGRGRGNGSDVIVSIQRGGESNDLSFDFAPTENLPQTVGRLAVTVGKELGLNDLDVLSEVRIQSGTALVSVYQIHVLPVITSHRSMGATALLLSPQDRALRHSELDLAGLTLSVGTITAKMKSRSPSLIAKAFLIGRNAALGVMGTPNEAAAYEFIQLPADKYTGNPRRAMEKLMVEIARPLTYGDRVGGGEGETPVEFELTEEDAEEVDVPAVAELKTPSIVSSQLGDDSFTDAKRAGAARYLGLMASKDGLPLIEKIAQRDASKLRQAAAFALSGYPGKQGIKTLWALLKDDALGVRLAAASSLLKRGTPPDNLRTLAKEAVATRDLLPLAADILSAAGTAEDVAIFQKLYQHTDRTIRRKALLALLRVSPSSVGNLKELLRAGDIDTVAQVIRQLPNSFVQTYSMKLIHLTNDPNQEISWAARDRLAAIRPAEAPGRWIYDLQTNHFLARHRLVRQLATMREPWAEDVLAQTCGNAEPHTRIAALKALSSRNLDRVRPLLLKALSDVHLLVRLESAALLAQHATADETQAIRAAIGNQKDTATRLYLEDALARGESRPLPTQQTPARTIPKDRNLAWLCGAGNAGSAEGSMTSPYDAYYMMSTSVRPGWKKVYENTKKIYIGRAMPIADPGPIQVDPVAQDSFWLTLDAELTDKNLPWLDGVLYGEETMSMTPAAIWRDGWRIFCKDAGIDRKRVAGNIEKLNQYEQRAWTTWAMRRIVEGFNRLYDYTKLKYGKLRPGFQVATFLGEQGLWAGPNVADFDWKFDIGGVYHYFGDSRKTAYALVRRYKTIWPERPVIWLSHGIGVYERTPIKYNHKAPTGPITARWWRSYRDSMTAWLAGADTGWFSIWGFMDHDYSGGGISGFKGPTITPEEFSPSETPGKSLLDRCIEHAFKGVEKVQRNKAEIKKQDPNKVDLDAGDAEEGLDVGELDTDESEDVIGKGIDDDKARLRTGFFFYRKYLYDLARLFRSLPRHSPSPQFLVIHPIQNVWYGSLDSPGADLPVEFDFLIDINKVNHLDLGRYRFITVQNPAALEDKTIQSITKWLKEEPGILYVHLNLTTDNTAQSGTLKDFSGRLKLDWPWEKSVTVEKVKSAKPGDLQLESDTGPTQVSKARLASAYKAEGQHGAVLGRIGLQAAVVLWKHPEFKGGVLFDGIMGGGGAYRVWLRDQLNNIHTKHGIGPKLRGPIRQMLHEGDAFTAAAATGIGQAFQYKGPDLITGWTQHELGRASGAAFLPREMHTPNVAAGNGVAILTENPIKKYEKVAGGINIQTAGLIHAVSSTGSLTVLANGKPLPPIAADTSNDWILQGKNDGVFRLSTNRGKTPGSIYFIRSTSLLAIKTAPYSR
jgi:HEAT repeat protein